MNKKAGCCLAIVIVPFLLCGCASACVNAADVPQALSDPSLFYRGLKAESQYRRAEAAGFFEQALESHSPGIRREAAMKLGVLLTSVNAENVENADADTDEEPVRMAGRILRRLERFSKTPEGAAELSGPAFTGLQAAALYAAGRYDELAALFAAVPAAAPRDRALLVLARPEPETVREFFYGERETFGNDREAEALFRWVLGGLEKREFVLSPADEQAIAGRLALFRNDYGQALACFDAVRKENQALLFTYPELLGELGKAYQWAASRRTEGLNLFTGWEKTQKAPLVRYYSLFYAGRITRQQGNIEGAISLFTRALELAPDERQEDACIWYILDAALSSKAETAADLVKLYARRWHRDAAFIDILDGLCRSLTDARKWREIGDIVPLIQDKGAAAAQYAYIMGRAVEEGYVSVRGKTAADYFTIAYEEGNASFYYRALAASHLDKSVVPLDSGNAGKTDDPADVDALEFYRGFFDHDAEEFLMPYLRKEMSGLSVPLLRAVAGMLADRGRYLDSITVVRPYMRRSGYTMERSDLELYYPRAFTGIIDEHAGGAGIPLPVFYGLVRTESGFMPEIVSHAGAVGLAQIMPATAKEVNAMIQRRGGPDLAENGHIDLRKPEVNVYLGAFYLNHLTNSLGSPMLALLGYNGGPARVRRLRRAAPSLPEDLFLETIATTETREYGKRVMAAAAAYGYLYYGMSMEEIVADIFK